MSTNQWTYGTYVCGYWSSTPNKRERTSIGDYASASGTNSNNKKLAYSITSSDNSAWICSSPKYYGKGVRPVYCNSVYRPSADFIQPEGKIYVGRPTVLKISGCWWIPNYGKISSRDSGTIYINVTFDKEGVVKDISMNGVGPVSNNKETCNAIETEIRSKKMTFFSTYKKPIPDETSAKISYEFR